MHINRQTITKLVKGTYSNYNVSHHLILIYFSEIIQWYDITYNKAKNIIVLSQASWASKIIIYILRATYSTCIMHIGTKQDVLSYLKEEYYIQERESVFLYCKMTFLQPSILSTI